MAKTKIELTDQDRKVLKRVIKRPRSALEIARMLGYESGRAVSKTLRKLGDARLIASTPKGYVSKA